MFSSSAFKTYLLIAQTLTLALRLRRTSDLVSEGSSVQLPTALLWWMPPPMWDVEVARAVETLIDKLCRMEAEAYVNEFFYRATRATTISDRHGTTGILISSSRRVRSLTPVLLSWSREETSMPSKYRFFSSSKIDANATSCLWKEMCY